MDYGVLNSIFNKECDGSQPECAQQVQRVWSFKNAHKVQWIVGIQKNWWALSSAEKLVCARHLLLRLGAIHGAYFSTLADDALYTHFSHPHAI